MATFESSLANTGFIANPFLANNKIYYIGEQN
jgi:hypothetical protein